MRKHFRHLYITPKFYLAADTNLQQLGGNDSVIKEYLGGLFNRFIIVYTKDVFSYENAKFNTNKLSYDEIAKFESKIVDLMKFYKKESYEIDTNALKQNENYDKFCRLIHSKKQNKADEFKELYTRVVQNLNAIIQTLHYLKQYEIGIESNFRFNPKVADNTINEAIKFIGPYINLTLLFSEINGQSDDIQNVHYKMLEYIKAQISKKGSCGIKDIAMNRAFRRYRTDDIRAILKDFVIEENGNLTILD